MEKEGQIQQNKINKKVPNQFQPALESDSFFTDSLISAWLRPFSSFFVGCSDSFKVWGRSIPILGRPNEFAAH